MMLVMTIFGATSPKRTAAVSPALPIGFAVSLDILAGVSFKNNFISENMTMIIK